MPEQSTTTHAFVDELPIDGRCDICGSSVAFHSVQGDEPVDPAVERAMIRYNEREFIQQIARLTKDGECTACGLVGDDEPYDCGDHHLFDMPSDDAVDTLHSLITSARELTAKV